MKVIDLFSGIGGFSLGLESTGGFETVQFVENNKWCQKVLAKNFPGVPITGDIKNYEPKRSDGIGLVCGGFPCQPFSVAGKRKGTEDDRHLWPEMLRVIKASKPRWVIGENVRNLTSIQDGMVFEQVCTDLENEGYEVQSFIIPASAVNAPHQRYRVWIVAHSESIKSREQTEWERGKDTERGSDDSRGIKKKRSANVADSKRMGCSERTEKSRESENEEPPDKFDNSSQGCSVRKPSKDVADSNDTGDRTPKYDTKREGEKINKRREGLTQSESSKLSKFKNENWCVEPNVGRVANGISNRVDRLKGLGNAIVPQIVYQIGLAILEAEKTNA